MAEFADAPPGIAAQGVEDTLAALAAGKVRTLLLSGDAAGGGRRAWFGPEELCLSRIADRRPPAHEGALVDVAVRAALLADGRVCVIESGAIPLVDGLGGLCRYA